MGENFTNQNLVSVTTVGGLIDLRMPVVATPARTPGSFGLVNSEVHVRLRDQSILILSATPPTPNLQQVTTAGNSTTLGINVGGHLNMTATNLTNDPTDVLTVASTAVPPTPVGGSAFVGSLVYCTTDFTLYLRDNAGWVALDTTTVSNWAAVLAAGSASGGTNPTISAGDQLLHASAIQIGQTGAITSAAANTIAIGRLATTSTAAAGSISLGNNSAVTFGPGIAVGSNATSSGVNSQAFGISSSAAFDGSTAIGYQAVTSLANTIQMGSASTDTLFGRYISTGITEGGRVSYGPPSPPLGSIINNDTFVNLPTAYDTVNWENIRPGSGFVSYVAAGNVLVNLPNNGYFAIHSVVTGIWSADPGNGPVKSRLLWNDNGTPKNLDILSASPGGGNLSWTFTNSATFKSGSVGAQTVEVEISIGVAVAATFTPSDYFIEVVRIS